MGGDCSSCKCGNNEEEKILIINPDAEKTKDFRKNKLESRNSSSTNHLEKYSHQKEQKVRGQPITNKERLNEILEYNPGLEQKIIKIQSLIRKYKDRSIYLMVRNRIRVSKYKFIIWKIMQMYRNLKYTLPLVKKEKQ